MSSRTLIASLALVLAAPAMAETETAPVGPEAALATLPGDWTGELQYLDYQSGEWFGIPMEMVIETAPDGHALIRTAKFDDGPVTGDVYIVTVSAFDAQTGLEESATFRKGRAMETYQSQLRLEAFEALDAWTLISEREGVDDDRPALIRETTVRDGASVSTLKEVDYTDDEGEAWLTRNRTVLTRADASDEVTSH